MNYNTERERMMLREYGRHVQRIVVKCQNTADRELRNQMAKDIIELMIQLNPQIKSIEDYRIKLWDHLFFIADFNLDVESPYPIPTRAEVEKKPEPLPYPKGTIKHKHYGKNIEALVNKAIEEKDLEKRQAFAQNIGNCMKLVYQNWTRENNNDDNIKNDLRILSNGMLQLGSEDNISELTKGNKYRSGDALPRNNGYKTNTNNNNKFKKKYNNKNRNK